MLYFSLLEKGLYSISPVSKDEILLAGLEPLQSPLEESVWHSASCTSDTKASPASRLLGVQVWQALLWGIPYMDIMPSPFLVLRKKLAYLPEMCLLDLQVIM